MTSSRGRKRRLSGRSFPSIKPGNQILLRLLTAYASRAGLTLRQLASRLGVTYSMIDKWRSEEALMARSSDEVLNAIAKLLGVPPVLVRLVSGALDLDAFLWPGDKAIDRYMIRRLTQPQGDWLTPRPNDAVAQRHRLLYLAAMLQGEWEHGAKYLERTQRWLEEWEEPFTGGGTTDRE